MYIKKIIKLQGHGHNKHNNNKNHSSTVPSCCSLSLYVTLYTKRTVYKTYKEYVTLSELNKNYDVLICDFKHTGEEKSRIKYMNFNPNVNF